MTSIKSLLAALFLLTSSQAYAVDKDINDNDVILAGYDAVAYFTLDKAVLGKANITAVYDGAIYRFSHHKHRDMFKQNPAKYAPQFGGFCAYGMTFGKKFNVDGKAFKIVDGKLYVNKNLAVYQAWSKDIPLHIKQANQQWPKVKNIAAKEL